MTSSHIAGQGGSTRSAAVALLIAATLLSAAHAIEPGAAATAPAAATTQSAASASASRPTRPVLYQPGVSIDWTTHQVLVAGQVVLRTGDLELFACSPGTKEHESIVQVQARPLHIYQALGLLGFEPGHPAYFDNSQKKVIPPTGDRLEISVRWTDGGQPRTVPIEQWLYDKNRKASPLPIDWVFAGSVPTEDGQILADYEGTVLCVVDFDGSVIAVAASHSSSNAELWLSANTDQIPPAATPVTLIVQAARPRLLFQVDRFGRLGQAGKPATLRQLVQAARDAAGKATGILQYDPAVPDIQVHELLTALRQAGLSEVSAEPLPAEPPVAGVAAQRTEVEEQGLAILQALADVSRQLPSAIDAVAKSARDRYRRLSERAAAAGHAAAGAARAFGSGQAPASQPGDVP